MGQPNIFLKKISVKHISMSELKVYRASAGSGKTYTLTQEYIFLLFKDPGNYRQILAVTFTNKATTEMRSRILSTLNNLAHQTEGTPEHMLDLQKEFKLSTREIRQKSALLLGMLLHDFSRFSISTIDSFFQKVTRSFAREMGLPIGFRLELETNHIMLQAIDQLILEMDAPQHKSMKAWLIDFARERMEQDNKWNISQEIQHISREIFKEKYQANAALLTRQIKDKNYLSAYKSALQEIITNVDQQIRSLGEQGLNIIQQFELDLNEDFQGKSRTKVRVFERMLQLSDHLNLSKFEILLEGPDKWTHKDNSSEKNSRIETAYYEGFNTLLLQAKKIITEKSKDYFTARLILKELNALGLIHDVYEKMMQLCREQNIFMISGTNYLLTRIIDNNETPFIYEKTGTRYAHYMMDEFQDTSTLQYLNFVPLVNDSLAANNYALMVGDVKQAIYRWRNSDWNLLAEAVEKDYRQFGVNLNTLDTNYRSSSDVIRFNNDFFGMAASTMQQQFNNLVPEDIANNETLIAMQSKISSAYFDVQQKVPLNKEQSGGQIYIQLIEAANKENFGESAIPQTIMRIASLAESSYALSDICVLVRNNKEGVEITNALLSGLHHPHGISLPVISNESLILSKSEAIKLIVEQLRYIQNPENQLSGAFIRLHLLKQPLGERATKHIDVTMPFHGIKEKSSWEAYHQTLMNYREKPIYELVESLIALLPESLKTIHSVYIQSFMSLCLNYINQETADLNQFLDYWDRKGFASSLSIPDNQQAIRVMTIHKSKGLEFKAVVVPFANWEMNNLSHRDLLWLTPKTEPFNAVALVPVSGASSLAQSHFAEAYLDETLHQYVDNLNVTYVAFTRARESLTIIGHIKKKEKLDNYKQIGDLLYHFAAKGSHDIWDEENLIYEVNHLKPTAKDPLKKEEKFRLETEIEGKPFEHIPLGNQRARIHMESENFFNSDGAQPINHGKIMHQLFEHIVTAEDIDKALSIMRFEGKIEGDEMTAYQNTLQTWLKNPAVVHWFDGSFTVKTEADILSAKVKRPDRVMIKDNEVVVVDYKFGQQKHHAHHAQVRNYMQLLKKMKYSKVTGYLWYTEINEVIQVDGQGSLF
jgi:ATP-dependent exoDNAse (exonuclease V) beta subunit